MIKRILLAGAAVLLSFMMADATLWDRGDGLIYDDVQNVTWLQDMNYAATSGYHRNGLMEWKNATKWVANLDYQNLTDWRLPTSDELVGFVADGEMGSVFYDDLIDRNLFIFVAGSGIETQFTNPQDNGYWTSTVATYGKHYRWTFNMNNGAADWIDKKAARSAWAVMDGDIPGGGTGDPDALQFGGVTVTFNTVEVIF
jgi:hypothetical protein